MIFRKICKSNKLLPAVAAVLSLTLVSGCGGKGNAELEKAPEGKPVSVVSPVKMSMSPDIGLTGNLFSKSEVALVAKIAGTVDRVYVDEGDRVTEGQLLLKINDDSLRAQYKQIEANLAQARTQYDKARTGSAIQGSQTSVAVNQAEQAKLQAELSAEQVKFNLNQSKTDYERMSRLYERGAVSKQEMENYRLKYDTTKKQYDTAQSIIKNSEESIRLAKANTAQVDMSRDDIAAAAAQIESLQASLEMLSVNIRDCEIRAPFSGVITYRDKSVSRGAVSVANPSMPVFKMVDNGNLYMEGTVGEGKIAALKVGDAVSVYMDAYPGKNFEGRLETVVPAVDPSSMSVSVRVAIDNSANELKSGMFGRASIHREPITGLAVPNAAVIEAPYLLEQPGDAVQSQVLGSLNEVSSEQNYIVYLAKSGKAVRAPVTVGAKNEKDVLIVDGLTENDKVITTSVRDLQDQEGIVIDSK